MGGICDDCNVVDELQADLASVTAERNALESDNDRLREAIKKIVYEYDEFDKWLTWDKNYKGSRIYQTVIVARSEKLANTVTAAEAAIKEGK
jgi:hypothetical protein